MKLAFDFNWFSTPTCNVTVDRGRHVLVSSFLSKPYYGEM